MLPEPKEGDDEKESKPRFAKEIEKLQMLQAVNESKHKDKSSEKEAEKKDAAEEDEVAPLVQEQVGAFCGTSTRSSNNRGDCQRDYTCS